MGWLLAAAGLTVLVLALVDFVWTALSLRGVGPITGRISRGIWLVLRSGRRWPGGKLLLGAAGPSILSGTILGWAFMIWLGWFLVFLATPGAVLVAPQMQPADGWGRLYFAGFTITTLGVGDLTPGGPPWQVLTAIGGLNGLIVITTGITYLLAVVSAVVEMRALASHVASLGRTAEEFVLGGWDGRSFTSLQDHLTGLTPQVLLNVQQQSAYPILRYFRAPEATQAAGPALAVLDEALVLLAHGVAPELRPPSATLRPLRIAIGSLLQNVTPENLQLADDAPPPPKLERLRAAGIPTVDDEAFHRVLEAHARRRRLLLAMVSNEGWEWDAMRLRSCRGFREAELL